MENESKQNEDNFIILPVKKNQLGNFLEKLLGQPQRISNYMTGTFEINKDNIRNLDSLISQRIQQQNELLMKQYSCQILLSNSDLIELKSLEDFLTYTPIDNSTAIAIDLSWSFIIKFHDKQIPEKQSINIQFITDGYDEHVQKSSFSNRNFNYRRGGQVIFEILHTARS